jgi:SAM-dependent methyltransferase
LKAEFFIQRYNSKGDGLYYQPAGNNRLVRALSLRSRHLVIKRFNQLLRPGADTSILDVGVSLAITGIEVNLLEQVHPYQKNITCAGIGSGHAVIATYPEVRFVQISPDRPLPFPDGSFDIAYSNAVIEHVGSREQQRRFVSELCRVGKRVFITTPNLWFPIEHHTGIPLLHYLPLSVFRGLLRSTRLRFWSDVNNLNPLTASELRQLFPSSSPVKIETLGLGFGPLRSNLLAVV